MSWEKEMKKAILKIKSACEKNPDWTKCYKCPFDECCNILYEKLDCFPSEWEIEEK